MIDKPVDRGSKRVWVVTELYYPEETSTGYLLTRIAEHLAASFPVSVLCSQPTYRSRGLRAPVTEVRNGARIRRCFGTTFDKNSLVGRVMNMLTITASIFFRALLDFRRGDVVMVVTNPPLLPFFTTLAAKLRGAKCIVLVHDVYPEVMVASGMTRPDSPVASIVGGMTRRLYRSVLRVIAIGRDMKRLAEAKLPPGDKRVVLIPNWADVDTVFPEDKSTNGILNSEGLQSKLVVQYAGNMGRSHDIESILSAADSPELPDDVFFLFLGDGKKRKLVEQAVRSGLPRVRLLYSFPRERQREFLNACDLAIISFVPGMTGISVPSRMYNIFAAGKPILAIADSDSELALVIREHNLGWVLPPGSDQQLPALLKSIDRDRASLAEMGRRAREVAERYYAADVVLADYDRLIRDVIAA